MPRALDRTSDRLLAAHPVAAALELQVGKCGIRVGSNSRPLVDALAGYFGPFKGPATPCDIAISAIEAETPVFDADFQDWPRDAGKTGRKDVFADVDGGRIVRKVRTGMQFLLGHRHRVAIGPCLRNRNQIVNFVVSQYMSRLIAEGWLVCHASAVVHADRGFAFAGFSGGGKSTLALHLLSRGLAYASNDRVLLRRHGSGGAAMAGVPKWPRVNPGTLLGNPDLARVLPPERRAHFQSLDRDALWAIEEKYDVDVPAAYGGGRVTLAAPLAGVFILNWRRDDRAPTAVQSVALEGRPELLRALVKSPGPFYVGPYPAGAAAEGESATQAYLDALAPIAVYELRGRLDFAWGVDACLEIAGGP